MKHRPLASAGVAAIAAAAVVALIGTGLGWWSSPSGSAAPSSPIAVRASLDPGTIFFGDPVVAQVEVDIDPHTVDAGTVRVEPGFDPFVESSPPAIARVRDGSLETLRYTYSIQCVTDGCLPSAASHTVQLPPLVVTAQSRSSTQSGSKKLTVKQPWPAEIVNSRLQRSDLATSTPHFLRPAALPSPVFGTSPVALANLLTAAAAVLALAALALLGLELRALFARRRHRAHLTRLESAIAFVRQSAQRPDPADRRKALELLAGALELDGKPALAGSAERLAWEESPPSPERASALADEAAATVEPIEP